MLGQLLRVWTMTPCLQWMEMKPKIQIGLNSGQTQGLTADLWHSAGYLISSYTYNLFFEHHCVTHFSCKIQSEGEAGEAYRPWLVLQGYGTREQKTTSSLLFSWISPVMDNVKVSLSTWCTCIVQDMHFFVVTITRRKRGWVRCAM